MGALAGRDFSRVAKTRDERIGLDSGAQPVPSIAG
jgi:hypothetical protein